MTAVDARLNILNLQERIARAYLEPIGIFFDRHEAFSWVVKAAANAWHIESLRFHGYVEWLQVCSSAAELIQLQIVRSPFFQKSINSPSLSFDSTSAERDLDISISGEKLAKVVAIEARRRQP